MDSAVARVRARFLLPVLLLTAMPEVVRAQAPDPCTSSPEVRAAIQALPVRSISETTWEYRQRWLEAMENLAHRYPDDMFVQRTYAMQGLQEKAVAEYKARYEQKPDDPKIAFLYGLTLEGRNSPEAIRVLEDALAKAPSYPWPHRPLSRIYNAPAFLNKDRAVAHMKAFLDACPAEIGGLQQLATVDDKALLTATATRVRALIEKRSDAEAVAGYPALWSLEFKTHSTSEYAAVRRQVSQDLERIRSLQVEDKQQWYSALQAGYKLVNDQKQADWAAEEQERRFPAPMQLAAMTKWYKDHPRPKPEDPPGKKREFFSGLLQQTGQWLKERPNAINVWGNRFDAMAQLDDTSAADLEAAGEEYVRLADRDAGPKGATSWVYFNVAEALAKRHLKPQRVVELAQRGVARLEVNNPPSDLYITKDTQTEYEFYKPFNWLHGAAIEAGGRLELKQADAAKSVLARMDERLKPIQKLAGAKEEYRTEYAGQMATYWGLMARAAELQEHSVDAMTFYTSALVARLDSQQKLEAGAKDELVEDAHRLWTKMGGTREGWNTWYGQRADSLAKQTAIVWEPVSIPLAGFELTDVKGKTWSLASLKGKVNFLNFWASW